MGRKLILTPDKVAEFAHLGHPYLCPGQIVTALDCAAVESRAFQVHAWDFETNVESIEVDAEERTITFKLKGET